MTDFSIHTAEFVFPGHPDKISDAIADALVAEAITREERALVGVEVAVHRNKVFITGRIACRQAEEIDIPEIVKSVFRSAGYGPNWYPSPEELIIQSDLCLGDLEDGEDDFRELSDDQAICIGYACNTPETNYLPVEQWLAKHLAARLYALRNEQPHLQLGPDGKVLVLVREENDHFHLENFSCSLQQVEAADDIALHRAVRQGIEQEILRLSRIFPKLSPIVPEHITVNGAGAFEVGGTEGDNGLSGKKLVVDAYGPRVPIGGGAWSGKDFFKADRAGGLHARRIAKAIIALGMAKEATIILAWFPGDREASIVRIVDEEGRLLPTKAISALFDRSLKRSGVNFSKKIDLIEIARWGHFSDPDCPWEVSHRI